jgi:hypothetical protein
MAVSTKIAVFWVVAPCSTNVSEVLAASIFRATAITLMMEAARTSGTLVNFYQTTQRYNPKDNHLNVKHVQYNTISFALTSRHPESHLY